MNTLYLAIKKIKSCFANCIKNYKRNRKFKAICTKYKKEGMTVTKIKCPRV